MAYQVQSTTDGRNGCRQFDILPAAGDVISLDGQYDMSVTDVMIRSDGSVCISNANYILILTAI
jgi:hypothetical protein